MKHVISPKSAIDLYLLTLNGNLRDRIQEKVSEVASLVIDGVEYQNDLRLVQMYPEGYGASLYASKVFPDVDRVAVLDIGNGTLNLSQYHTKAGYPRREMFYYLPFGFSAIVNNAVTLFTEDTSNGVVNEQLVREAMVTNTYLYLSDYKGKNIEKTTDKAVKVWLDNPKVKTTMVQVINLLNKGIPVIACGGGFEVNKVRDGVANVLGNNNLFHIPENPISLGVTGLYHELATETLEATVKLTAKEKRDEQAA